MKNPSAERIKELPHNVPGIGRVVVISGKTLLQDYNRLKAEGYKTLWTGNGKICMAQPVTEARA